MNKPENLLIVRTDRIGDVVLSLPLAGIVKKHYPSCKITFLVREYTRDVVSGNPNIDNIITIKENSGKITLLNNAAELRAANFDACIVVYPTFITSLIIFLSRIKVRIGTGYRWYSFLFNRRVYVHRKYADKHELEFNVEMLQQIGIDEDVNIQNVKFDLYPDEQSGNAVKVILQNSEIKDVGKRPLIIVHPGSGGSAADLPLSKLKELVSLIDAKLNVDIILTGSKKEVQLCEQLCVSDRIKNMAGKFSLSELIALINMCSIFVANSTGPIHIAAALGKYTIGFYPNITACSSRRWGPYSSKTFVFTPPVNFNPGREQVISDNGMNNINVTEIFVRIEKICNFLD